MNLKENKNTNVKKIKKKKCQFLFDFVKITGAIPALCWLRPKVVKLAKKKESKPKGVLVCSNHIGWLDPVILHCVFWYRRLHCLTMKELFNNKLKNFFFRRMNCIPVDRHNFSMESFHDVCDSLKDGKAVLIFPEGKINVEKKESTSAYKSGAVLMAYQSNVPILPVCVLPIKKWYNRRVVLVGDLVDVRNICGERPSLDKINYVTKRLQEIEDRLLLEYYETKGRKKTNERIERISQVH